MKEDSNVFISSVDPLQRPYFSDTLSKTATQINSAEFTTAIDTRRAGDNTEVLSQNSSGAITDEEAVYISNEDKEPLSSLAGEQWNDLLQTLASRGASLDTDDVSASKPEMYEVHLQNPGHRE